MISLGKRFMFMFIKDASFIMSLFFFFLDKCQFCKGCFFAYSFQSLLYFHVWNYTQGNFQLRLSVVVCLFVFALNFHFRITLIIVKEHSQTRMLPFPVSCLSSVWSQKLNFWCSFRVPFSSSGHCVIFWLIIHKDWKRFPESSSVPLAFAWWNSLVSDLSRSSECLRNSSGVCDFSASRGTCLFVLRDLK